MVSPLTRRKPPVRSASQFDASGRPRPNWERLTAYGFRDGTAERLRVDRRRVAPRRGLPHSLVLRLLIAAAAARARRALDGGAAPASDAAELRCGAARASAHRALGQLRDAKADARPPVGGPVGRAPAHRPLAPPRKARPLGACDGSPDGGEADRRRHARRLPREQPPVGLDQGSLPLRPLPQARRAAGRRRELLGALEHAAGAGRDRARVARAHPVPG